MIVRGGSVSISKPYSVDKLTAEARRLAADYRRATGKTLPLSGEIAANDARRLLDLDPPAESVAGCDAVRRTPEGIVRVQIKGRVVFGQGKGAPRVGQLKLDQGWDETVLVLLDDDYEPFEIYRAGREAIETALAGKSQNKRGAMTVAQFRIIAQCVWTRAGGVDSDAG
jgi:hypothetical protein